MFTAAMAWLKGLSVVSKVAVGIVGFSAVGAMAAPTSPTPSGINDTSEVKATTVTAPKVTTETVIETEPIEFTKQTVESDSLNKGVSQITTAGVNGVKTKTYTITLSDGIQTNKVLAKEENTTLPINEITTVGTYVEPSRPPVSSCDPNYSPCVPNVSYDLDCPDIGFNVRIIGSDPHGFDRDRDGYGCESY